MDPIKIELCTSEVTAEYFNQIVQKNFYKDNSKYDVIINGWREESSSFSASADMHVIMLDTEEWMDKSVITVLTNINKITVKQLLVLRYFPNKRFDSLNMMFEAFHVDVDYIALPEPGTSVNIIKESIIEVIARRYKANSLSSRIREGHWDTNLHRVTGVLKYLTDNGMAKTRYDAWESLNYFSGDENVRKKEEHDLPLNDVMTDDDIKILFNFQSRIDLYYLAVARKNSKISYTYSVIEDNIDKIINKLKFIASVTGDSFYVTKNAEECQKLYTKLKSKETQRSIHDLNWLDDGMFEKISYNEILPSSKNPNYEIPDAILVDLIIDNKKGVSIKGEDIIHHLHERYPSMPVFVVTKSEEPDVLTRCVKLRGADKVVPKRRLLRLPYVLMSYLSEEVSRLVPVLENTSQELSKRLIGAFRTWSSYPGILWHGEKVVHAAEHSLEHTLGLWKLADQLLSQSWDHINQQENNYNSDHLFRFFMAIWLHDIGSKGSEAYQMADQVRDRHSWISGQLLHRNPELYFLKRGEEADVVELICAYHQSCAPFKEKGPDEEVVTEEVVKGLFHQSLEEIEKASEWKLMEWTALLRLLDAMEHNWRRVGSEHLYKAKKATISIDAKYYRERAYQSIDAKNYADWLEKQDKHMKKHMSVLDVNIKTRIVAESFLFWPVYTFASSDDAKKYLPEIGLYILKEWHDTGNKIKENMKIRLPVKGEINTEIHNDDYCVLDLNDTDYNDLKQDISTLKGLKEESEDDRKIKVEKIWNCWEKYQ